MRSKYFIEIHGKPYFQSDIERMTKNQIHGFCGFLDNERDLRWVQEHCLD